MTTSPATRPAGTPGASPASLPGVDARVRRSTRQCCRGVERMRVGRRAAAFFPLAASYRFCGDQGPGRGVRWSSARPEARGGRCRKVREGKGTKGSERESCRKSGGDECVFIPGEGPGWQMRSGPTPYRTRRAVRTVTGPLDRMAQFTGTGITKKIKN
jgi:hypothetical protein